MKQKFEIRSTGEASISDQSETSIDRKKLNGPRKKVWIFGNLNFGFVSYFDIRISDLKMICGLTLIIGILVFGSLSWAGEVKRCIVCGMDISKYPHTKYVVTTTEGKEFITCGVQCGLTLHLRLKEKFKSSMATDLLSNRPFEAQKGFYVYKSTVITDMAPGFISFATRTNAEQFQKGFGGKVVTYQEALEIWKEQMK